ncbi:MAG: hypothetical protein COA32_05445 [Fluviicola sp.]|nr:MAG: hypothetical protein COA32_05445 [Fluviicola sp.]
MGLYLLNISVDTIDENPSYIPEDLSINDQESIIEIIVEKVLGYENAIAEHDDNDTNERSKKSSIKIDLITNPFIEEKEQFICPNSKALFPNPYLKLSLGYIKIDTPPPLI